METVQEVIDLAGNYWALALAGAFVAALFESAKPKAKVEEGEAAPTSGVIGFALALMGLATPILLIVHVFVSGMEARSFVFIVGVAMVFGAIIVASILGLIIRAAGPGLGRALSVISPGVTGLVFILTVALTWHSVPVLLHWLAVRYGFAQP